MGRRLAMKAWQVVPAKRFWFAIRTMGGTSALAATAPLSKKPVYLAPTTIPKPISRAKVIPNKVLARIEARHGKRQKSRQTATILVLDPAALLAFSASLSVSSDYSFRITVRPV